MASKTLILKMQKIVNRRKNSVTAKVFFKGCNLNCSWCYIPEAITNKQLCSVDNNKCINCNNCKQIDLKNLIKVQNDKRIIVNQENVNYINYLNICPSKAIHFDSTYYTVDELLKILLKDQVFYNQGGGIIITGGEPLLEINYLLELLKILKSLNIKVTLHTSLNVNLTSIKKVLPYIETLHADFKIFEDLLHQKHTGISNVIIKNNINYLLTSEYKDKVIIQTPLIPIYTTSKSNLQKIAQYVYKLYPEVRCKLLNFDPSVYNHYESLGLNYCFEKKYPKYTPNKMLEFEDIFRNVGIVNLEK